MKLFENTEIKIPFQGVAGLQSLQTPSDDILGMFTSCIFICTECLPESLVIGTRGKERIQSLRDLGGHLLPLPGGQQHRPLTPAQQTDVHTYTSPASPRGSAAQTSYPCPTDRRTYSTYKF